MHGLSLTIAVFVFALFVCAIPVSFKRERVPARMKALSLGACITFAAYIWAALRSSGSPQADVVGSLIHLSAGWLFLSAIRFAGSAKLPIAFSQSAPANLIDIGPYKRVRHPLYSSYSLYWLGCVIQTGSATVGIGAALLIATYVILASAEEKTLLSGDLQFEYLAYRNRTGWFWPKNLIKAPSSGTGQSV